MPSIQQLPPPLSILVFGDIRVSSEELDRLSFRHTIRYLSYVSREQAIVDIRRVAAEGPVDLIWFTDGSLRLSPVNKELLNPLLPHLSCICGVGAGYDHIDVDWLAERGIYYSNTPHANAFSTATTSTMLILQTIRAASQAEMGVRRGEWRGTLRPTPDTRGLVLGIIGMGTIGKILSQQVLPFGMNVVYHNRRRLSPEEENGATYVSLEELLRTADIISVNTPLTSQTRGMISDKEFALMRQGVFIVNTSRGAVINESALIRAMESGKVARVGLDVFEKEPTVNPYFMNSERATLLPHWGTSTTRVLEDGEREGFNNLLSYISRGIPNTPVNCPVGRD